MGMREPAMVEAGMARGCLRRARPDRGVEETDDTGDHSTREVDRFVVGLADGFSGAEAVDKHKHDDGGKGHAEDAEPKNFLREKFSGERLQRRGELGDIALGEHGGDFLIL